MMDREKAVAVCQTYLDCQCRLGEQRERHKDEERPFITISRQAGAGGITIGNKLVSLLNLDRQPKHCLWTVFDKNLVEMVLEEHHLDKKIGNYMPEKRVSEIRGMIEELFGLHPSEWALVHRTSETILHLAELGNVILVGRGANVITRHLAGGFHVRLVGSLDKRMAHAQAYYQLDRTAAEKMVRKEDAGRRDYLRTYFDRDIDDPLLYHLVINTDRISHDDAAAMISRQIPAAALVR